MTDTDIAVIRDALAAGPTPGEWQRSDAAPFFLIDAPGRPAMIEIESGEDADFIAACNPERIASLLDALESATKDAARYRWLRETGTVKGVIDWNALEWEYHDLPAMDAAIDAAMKEAT